MRFQTRTENKIWWGRNDMLW